MPYRVGRSDGDGELPGLRVTWLQNFDSYEQACGFVQRTVEAELEKALWQALNGTIDVCDAAGLSDFYCLFGPRMFINDTSSVGDTGTSFDINGCASECAERLFETTEAGRILTRRREKKLESERVALVRLIERAEKGDADASLALSQWYSEESGRSEEVTSTESKEKTRREESLRWLRIASRQGHELAEQYLLQGAGNTAAVANENSELPAELAELLKLASQGDTSAQFDVALMYDAGLGVSQDKELSASWLRKVADQNDTEAQFYLGAMCAQGQSVARDYVKAYTWLAVAVDQAVDQNRVQVFSERDTLEKKMTAAEIANAKRRARAWLPVLRGNKRSKRFHRFGCQRYNAADSQVIFRSHEEALAAGWQPATDCHQKGYLPHEASLVNEALGRDSAFALHGNKRSKRYHQPNCRNYSGADATVSFRSQSEAEAAGFRPAADCHRKMPLHGNRRSKRFHRPGCQHYLSADSTVIFRSHEKAIAAGFQAAADCHSSVYLKFDVAELRSAYALSQLPSERFSKRCRTGVTLPANPERTEAPSQAEGRVPGQGTGGNLNIDQNRNNANWTKQAFDPAWGSTDEIRRRLLESGWTRKSINAYKRGNWGFKVAVAKRPDLTDL